MGFSISGSAALIFAGLLIAFGMWHSAATDSFERISEAQHAEAEGNLEQRNTGIKITRTTYNASNSTLTVLVNNTGATSITLGETDLIVDNDYKTNWQGSADVNGQSTTSLWLPGERLRIQVTEPTEPNRVRVATQQGIESTEVIA